MGGWSPAALRPHEPRDGPPEQSEDEVLAAKQRQEKAVLIIAQSIATAREAALAAVPDASRRAIEDAFDTLIRQTVDGRSSAVTRFCEAESCVNRILNRASHPS